MPEVTVTLLSKQRSISEALLVYQKGAAVRINQEKRTFPIYLGCYAVDVLMMFVSTLN